MTTTVPDAGRAVLRQAEPADLLEVVRIERDSFPQPWPLGAFEQFVGQPGFLVADVDGRVVGYVVADTVAAGGRTLGHVKDLAVHADWRGAGLASRLLDRALAILRARGATHAKLEVRAGNEAARGLYRRFDFRPHHRDEGYYPDGEDALVLVKDLRVRPS